MTSVAVASRSFSNHPVLREELNRRFANVSFNDGGVSLQDAELVEFLDGHDMAITALEKIDSTILSKLPNLKVIGKYGVGLDMIDLHAMKEHGVKLGWTGGVNKRSVSELVISFAIAILHRAVFANAEVKRGEWYQIKGRQLSDCVVGIVGCGHIGKDLVKLLKLFGCKILAHDILDFNEFYLEHGVVAAELDELICESDVVTLHLPLDESTRNILDCDRLNLLKEGAVLINLARGGLLDEGALLELLEQDKLMGVALDVFAMEPPGENKIIHMDNVFVTSHIGGSTEEAILAMGMAAIDGLENARDPLSFLNGPNA